MNIDSDWAEGGEKINYSFTTNSKLTDSELDEMVNKHVKELQSPEIQKIKESQQNANEAIKYYQGKAHNLKKNLKEVRQELEKCTIELENSKKNETILNKRVQDLKNSRKECELIIKSLEDQLKVKDKESLEKKSAPNPTKNKSKDHNCSIKLERFSIEPIIPIKKRSKDLHYKNIIEEKDKTISAEMKKNKDLSNSFKNLQNENQQLIKLSQKYTEEISDLETKLNYTQDKCEKDNENFVNCLHLLKTHNYELNQKLREFQDKETEINPSDTSMQNLNDELSAIPPSRNSRHFDENSIEDPKILYYLNSSFEKTTQKNKELHDKSISTDKKLNEMTLLCDNLRKELEDYKNKFITMNKYVEFCKKNLEIIQSKCSSDYIKKSVKILKIKKNELEKEISQYQNNLNSLKGTL